eukprot:2050385-Pleurochrysis_carterae.AAC.2
MLVGIFTLLAPTTEHSKLRTDRGILRGNTLVSDGDKCCVRLTEGSTTFLEASAPRSARF